MISSVLNPSAPNLRDHDAAQKGESQHGGADPREGDGSDAEGFLMSRGTHLHAEEDPETEDGEEADESEEVFHISILFRSGEG